MHHYGTDSNERKYIPLLLAGLAIATALGFSRFLLWVHLTVPWWLDAPSTMGFYGLFYVWFDKKLWRIGLLRRLGLVKVPILDGHWQGVVRSSYDNHSREHQVEVQVKQTWTRISIRLESGSSRSHTTLAHIDIFSPEGIVLSYQYQNDPAPGAVDTMQIHHGTARLRVIDENTLEGDYYSGRGRQNYGSITLRKVQ
jgi:hypothetical protein